MTSRVTETRLNPNIVQGKITCGVCKSIMHQKISTVARIDLFLCKDKECKNSINRTWLFKMVRLAVEEHINRDDIDKELYDKEKARLSNKIEETKRAIGNKNGALMRAFRIKTEIVDSIEFDGYSTIINEHKAELAKFTEDLKKQKFMLDELESGFKSRKVTFSKNLNTFKTEIKDILHRVVIFNDEVAINILGWRVYNIQKPNSKLIGWSKRDINKEYQYQLPNCEYATGNHDLDDLYYGHINPTSEEEIDAYFESEEYKLKIKDVKSL